MSIKAVIYVKDIQKITGKSYRTSQREMLKIKEQNKLSKADYLSLSIFCATTKISLNDAILALNAKS